MSKFPTIKNNEEIGADIRNKLSPLKNLVAMIRDYNEESSPATRSRIWKRIEAELEQCEISIEYLIKLL